MDSKRAFDIEKMIAKFLKWTRIPFSGGKWFMKEDVESTFYLGQIKATENYAIKIDSRDVKTLESNAIKYHKKPCFIIHFDTNVPLNSTWCMIPINHFKEIMDEEEEE